MKENRNTCFDFLKGLACIGVVLIYVPIPGVAGEVVSKSSGFFDAFNGYAGETV